MFEIYKKLYGKWGKQGWWPVQTTGIKNKQLEVSLGAILTQNTSWNNVERAIKNLKENNLISRQALKRVNVKRLANLIKCSGHYKQKAKKIKIFVNYDGKINRENLLNLWGIGPETADSILLYAYDKPVFVIDAYTKRIFSRLGRKEKKYGDIQALVHMNLDSKYYNEFHALLVRLAKEHCKVKPNCTNCPLNDICLYCAV